MYNVNRRAFLAPRVASDSGEFRSLDKLDKWIYLDPIVPTLLNLQDYDTWSEVPDDLLKDHWKPDTRFEMEMHGLDPPDLAMMKLSPTIVAEVHKQIMRQGVMRTHMSDSSWREMSRIVAEASEKSFSIQVEHLLGGVDTTLFNLSSDCIRSALQKYKTFPPLLGKYWCAAEDMLLIIAERKALYREVRHAKSVQERVQERAESSKRRGNDQPFEIKLNSIKSVVLLTHDINILEMKGQKYILNEDLLLEVCNKVIEGFCVLLYNHIQSGTILPNNQYDCYIEFMKVVIDVYTKKSPSSVLEYSSHRANQPFKFGKAMECLGVAFMIKTEDFIEGWMNDRLLFAMWKELYNNGIVTEASFSDHPLGKLFDKMTTPQVADMIGTIKLFGHPSIELDLGAEQLYQRTHADLAIDPNAVRNGIGVIIRDLTKAFLIKHKRFPIILMDDGQLDNNVRTIFERRLYPDSVAGQRAWSAVTPAQWATVKFGKNAEFDPVDNQLVLIKDKALGLTRSQIWNLLLEDTAEEEKEKTVKLLKRRELRRTLLAFLSDPDFSRTFSRYFNNYTQKDPWDDSVLDYLVIKLTAKELELKEIGRFFGASPLVERNRRNVQEHNIKSLMSDLVNEQLMTQDELGIMRKLLSFRYFGNVYPECHLYQISFDFSKWNNNFRRESVDIPGAHILDRWFGTNLYGKTMQAFENSLFYLREEGYTRHWNGQLGGIEGLNQDTWSFLFLGGVKHALDEAGFKYQVTVKGDDVRAVIAVPEAQIQNEGDYNNIRDIILTRLQELCNVMGWVLNPQESFVSLTLIATSKQYQIRHTWLPAASKKIMKMMSLSNLLFPTLEDLIGSIFSCAHSACAQSTAVVPAFLSALFVASWELYRGFQKEIQVTSDMLAILALWPQILGGPGSLPLQTFFVRGENDMLSVSVSLFCSIIRFHNGGLKPIAERVLKQTLDKRPDMKLLISDPYSISLNIPERPSSLLKRLIRSKLKKWVKNEDIKMLLSDIGEREEKQFLEALSSMTPYLAKVATVIFECSPFYLIEEVLAKFMESPTVVALFSQGKLGNPNLRAVARALEQVLAASSRRKKYWTQIVKGNFPSDGLYLGIRPEIIENRGFCPTSITQQIRNTAWGREIVGITYPSLATQLIISPSMQFNRAWPDWNIHDLCYNVGIYADKAIPQTNLDSQHYAAYGDCKPWEGTETSSKIKMPRMESLVRTPTLNKVSKLILLHQMLGNLGPHVRKVLRTCLGALTYVKLDDVIMLMPRGEAGHIGHRLAINAFSPTTMPNFRHNILQLIRISDEHLTITKVDRTDRTINFVAIHFYLACISLFPLQLSQKLPHNYPTNIQAMFHPHNPRAADYEMCRACCCPLEDNFQLQFRAPFPDSMFKFASIRLVGCSDYENTMLIKAKTDLVMTKARSTIRQNELDPNDPAAIEEAANTVLSQLTEQSQTVLKAALSSNYFRVPTGPLLDTVKANIGLASLTSISITVLQAIPAGPLYRSLVVCLATYVIENLASSWSPNGLFDIELIAPYRNPLKHLFTKLISAGVMDRVVQGGVEMGWVTPAFSIGGGDLVSAARCSTSFLIAHKPLFRRWVDGHLVGVRFVPIINMESDEAIHDVLLRNYETRLGSLAHLTLSTCPSGKATHHIQFALCRLMREFPQPGESLSSHIQGLCNRDAMFVEGNLRVLFLGLLTNDIDQEDDEDFYNITNLSATIRLILAINYHWILRPGDWVDLQPTDLRRGEIYDIIHNDLTLDEPVLYPVNPAEYPPNVRAIANATSDEFTTCLRQVVVDIWNQIFLAEHALTRGGNNILNLLLDNIQAWLNPYRGVMINAVTEEESYRVLRTHGRQQMNDPINRSRLITDIAQLRAEAMRNARVLDARMFRCRMANERDHNEVQQLNYQRPTPLAQIQLMREYANGTVGQFIIPDEYTEAQSLFVDPVEIYRSIGRHNTSVSKYIEIFDRVSLRDRITDLGGDQPLFICLADGLGGVTAYLVQCHENAKVIYNSLLFDPVTGKPLADSGINQEPIEVMDPFISGINRNSVMYRGFGDGDLAATSVQDLIIDQCHRIHGQPVAITLDADIQWNIDLDTYYTMFLGALRIAVNTAAPNTICVFKTFLIRDLGLHWVLAFIYNSYTHVHLWRSSVTRQHSSEIFIVFSNPRNPDTLRTDLDMVANRTHSYSYNNAVVGFINQSTLGVVQGLTVFRLRGESNLEVRLHDWVRMIGRNNGYPLRLDVILRWFGISPDQNPPCYCNLWLWIMQNSQLAWEKITTEIFRDSQGRRRRMPHVGTSRGRELAGGRAFLRFAHLRIACLAVVRVLVPQQDFCQSLFTVRDEAGPIMDTIYRMIIRGVEDSIYDQLCILTLHRDYLYRQDRKWRDCLSNLVRQSIHKLYSIGGSMALINSCIAGVRPENQGRYLRAFFADLAILPCCADRAQARWREESRRVIPGGGIHVQWREEYHMFPIPNLNYDAHGNYSLRTQMRAGNITVHEDEEAAEHAENIGVEEPFE